MSLRACAACKYQRRRCSADCPLAPYFPPNQSKQFLNAHRLFGVSNILKILNKLELPQKTEAMRSIIYEANVRDRYPVHGCLGLIFALHLQIQHTQSELNAINAQLSLHRHRHHHHSSQVQLASLSSSFSLPTTSNSINAVTASGVQILSGMEHENDEISSSELSLKDMVQQKHVLENELKEPQHVFLLPLLI